MKKERKLKKKILSVFMSGTIISTLLPISICAYPSDWAFTQNSENLNGAIILANPTLDEDLDNYITKTEAGKLLGALLLSNKNITGTIDGIENFVDSYALYLNGNQFTGEIPENIGNLVLLENMYLHNNQLTGSIPSSIGKLEKLEWLYLANNQLSGSIPDTIGDLKKLTEMTIYNNRLNGSIPNNIGQLESLEKLYLFKNELTGPIPDSIGDLTKLRYLHLYNNKLSGEIPNTINKLTSLEKLNLSNNELSGEIPSNLTALANLTELYLYGNHITSVPENVYNFAKSIDEYNRDISGQTATFNILETAKASNDFEFNGIPAYEQFPNYGSPFVYTLKLPDSTSKEITPTISGGKVKISGSELTQDGNYVLEAKTSEGELKNSVYTTNFSATKVDANFLNVSADGEENKTSTGKIIIELTNMPASSELVSDNITLKGKDKVVTLTKGEVKSLGNNRYEVIISGDWVEGGLAEVTLNKSGVEFKPSTREVILHREKQTTNHIKVEANGILDKETTSEIIIDVSSVPNIGILSIDDITLTAKGDKTKSINKKTISSLGNGKYSITISGDWAEGGLAEVTLIKSGIQPSPTPIEISLHKASSNNTGGNNSWNTDRDTGKVEQNKKDHKFYVTGYKDLTFRADSSITRAEVVTIFSNILDAYYTEAKASTPSFNDVYAGDWYSGRLGYMQRLGIITGYPDGSFRGNEPITRAEFATMATNFGKLNPVDTNPFNDVDSTHWATKSILSSANKGWITGYPGGSFKPEQYITRAEVVTVVNNILERTGDEKYIDVNKDTMKTYIDLDKSHWAYYDIYEASENHSYRTKENKETWFKIN